MQLFTVFFGANDAGMHRLSAEYVCTDCRLHMYAQTVSCICMHRLSAAYVCTDCRLHMYAQTVSCIPVCDSVSKVLTLHLVTCLESQLRAVRSPFPSKPFTFIRDGVVILNWIIDITLVP